jgi:hypothetical protein
MGFGTGFATGLATSVDRMLQMDIQRNMDRMSRADNYLMTRSNQLIEGAEAEEKELKKELKTLVTLTGSEKRAFMAGKGSGGSLEEIKELNKRLKKNRDLLGDAYSLETFIDFTGEEQLADSPMSYADLLGAFTQRVTAPKVNPEFAQFTGIMGKLAGKRKMDLSKSTLPIPERFRADREDKFADAPAATISFAKGVEAQEYAAKVKGVQLDQTLTQAKINEYSANKDENFKTVEAILAYGTSMMLKNPEGTEEYNEGLQYYNRAMKAIKEKKARETDDTRTQLTPSAARGIANTIKSSIYEAPFSETFQDSIRAKLVGTDSYKSYFKTQPKVISEFEATNGRFNNDLTFTSLIEAEKTALANNIETYVDKFSMRKVDENKAATFDAEGNFQAYATAIPLSQAQADAQRGVYSVGDLINVRTVDGDEVIVTWTGTEWSNGG